MDALSLLMIGADTWVTFIFRSDGSTVLHAEGSDHNSTFTAVISKNLFSHYEFTSQENIRFQVHLATLYRSLLLLGAEVLSARSASRVSLQYSHVHEALTISMVDGEPPRGGEAAILSGSKRSIESVIRPRPLPPLLLDLRFDDALVEAEVLMDARTLRDCIQDFMQAGCPAVTLTIHSDDSVALSGSGPDVEITEECVGEREDQPGIAMDSTLLGKRHRLSAKTTVSTTHLAVAVGCKRVGWGSGGLTAFERIQLRINAVHQLSITHIRRSSSAHITVSVAIMPRLASIDW